MKKKFDKWKKGVLGKDGETSLDALKKDLSGKTSSLSETERGFLNSVKNNKRFKYGSYAGLGVATAGLGYAIANKFKNKKKQQ